MADPVPPGPPPWGLCREIDPTISPQWCCQWEAQEPWSSPPAALLGYSIYKGWKADILLFVVGSEHRGWW